MKSLKLTYFLIFTIFIECSKNSDSAATSEPTNNNIISAPINDVDGNIYQTVTICNQIWTQKNLLVSKYRNGDIIPLVIDQTEWKYLTTGAWCYYNNDPTNEAIYGKLYNWYAVMDPRGLAPNGWHVPSDSEFITLLENCLGGFEVAGAKIKEKGTSNWDSPNISASNSSGFTALPAGYRWRNDFNYIRKQANFWSTTEYLYNTDAVCLSLLNANSNADRKHIYKFYGFSVRCIKD